MTEIVDLSPSQTKREDHVLKTPWVAPEHERGECGFLMSDERIKSITRQLGRTSFENLQRVSAPEADPFKDLADQIKTKVIGQDAAVDKITDALSKIELRDPRQPIASFMFMGPTGVGKTELCRVLNEQLHPDGDVDIVRIDCSDFAEEHSAARLRGAPQGYVGYGKNTEITRKKLKPNKTLVLFDEIEKAHPNLQTLCLQMLEEGELKQSSGKPLNFRNTIIVFTSNVGSAKMQHELSGNRVGFRGNGATNTVSESELEALVMNEMKKEFLPEFLNRIDHKTVFHPHTDEQLASVLESHVAKSNERFRDKGIRLSTTAELRDALVKNSAERREYGARRIVRDFDAEVVTKLSKYVGSGSIKRGSHVIAYLDSERQEREGGAPYEFLAEDDMDVLHHYADVLKQEEAARRAKRERKLQKAALSAGASAPNAFTD